MKTYPNNSGNEVIEGFKCPNCGSGIVYNGNYFCFSVADDSIPDCWINQFVDPEATGTIEEMEFVEALIDQCYKQRGKERPDANSQPEGG